MAICENFKLLAKDPKVIDFYEKCKAMGYDHGKPQFAYTSIDQYRKNKGYPEEWFPTTESEFKEYIGWRKASREAGKSKRLANDAGRESRLAGEKQMYDALYGDFRPGEIREILDSLIHRLDEALDEWARNNKISYYLAGEARGRLLQEFGSMYEGNGFTLLVDALFKSLEPGTTEDFWKDSGYTPLKQAIFIENYKKLFANRKHITKLLAQKWGEKEGFYIKIKDSGEAEISELPSEDSLEENTAIDADIEAETDASDANGDGETEFSNGETFNDPRVSKMMEGLSPRVKRILSNIPTGRLNCLGQPVYARPNTILSYLRRVAEEVDNSHDMFETLKFCVIDGAMDEYYPIAAPLSRELKKEGFKNPYVKGIYEYLLNHPDDRTVIYAAVAGQHVEYVNARVRPDTGMQAASENGAFGQKTSSKRDVVMENFIARQVFVTDTQKYSIFDEHGEIRSDLMTEWLPRLDNIRRTLIKNGSDILSEYFRVRSSFTFDKTEVHEWVDKIITDDSNDITKVDKKAEDKLVYRFSLQKKSALEDFLKDSEVHEALEEFVNMLRGMGVPASIEALESRLRFDTHDAIDWIMVILNGSNYVLYTPRGKTIPDWVKKNTEDYFLPEEQKKRLISEGIAEARQNIERFAENLSKKIDGLKLLEGYESLDQRVQAKGKDGASSSYSVHTPQSLTSQMCKPRAWKRLREQAKRTEGYNIGGKLVGWFKDHSEPPRLLTELTYNDVKYGDLSAAQERTARFAFYLKREAYALPQQADYATGGQFVYRVGHFNLYSTGASRYSDMVVALAEEVLCEIERIKAIRDGLKKGTRKKLGLYDERGQLFHLFPTFNENAFLERYEAITDQEEAQEFLYKTVEAELQKVINDGIRTFDNYKICDNKNLTYTYNYSGVQSSFFPTRKSISFYNEGGASAIMKELKPIGECAFRIRTLKSNMSADFEEENNSRYAEVKKLDTPETQKEYGERMKEYEKWERDERKQLEEKILEAQQEVIDEMLPDTDYTPETLNHGTAAMKYELLVGYFANEFYAQYQMSRWLSGGLSFYKNEDDYNKRNGRLHAPHSTYDKHAMYHGQRIGRDNQNVVYLQDNTAESYYMDTIKEIARTMLDDKIITKDAYDSMIDAYGNIKTTDGVGIRTLESYRNVCIGTGTWTNLQNEAYIVLTHPYKYDADMVSEATRVIQKEIKPVMTGWEEVPATDDPNGPLVRVPVFHKYAEMVLLPSSTLERISAGATSPMFALAKAQEELAKKEKRVDLFIFNSGVKVGGFDALSPFAQDKSTKTYKFGGVDGMSKYLVDSLSGGQNIHTIDMEGWGIAASTTVHEDDEIALSLQAEYCAMANIADGDTVMYNGKEVLATEVRDEYFKIKALLLARGFKDGRDRLWNVDKLYDMLMKEVATKDYNSTDMQFYLQRLKEGDTSILAYPQIARLIVPNLTALLRKSMVKQRHSGSNIFETTVFGMDMDVYAIDNDFVAEEDKLGIRFKRDAYGNVYMDAIECALPYASIPWALRQYCEEDGAISAETLRGLIEQGIIDEDALRFMSYRTPADAEHSTFPCIIKCFMPPAAGNSMRMPKEAMVMDGHDYDGDKKRCHFKELTETNEGRIIADAGDPSADLQSLTEDQLYNRSIDLMLSKMRSSCGNKQMIPGGAGELSKIARKLYILQAIRSDAARKAIALPLAQMRLGKDNPDAESVENVTKHLKTRSDDLMRMLDGLSDGQLQKLISALKARESTFLPSHTAAAFENIMVGHNMIGIEATHGNAAKLFQRVNLSWIPRSGEGYDISMFGVDFNSTRPFDPNNRNNGMITSTIGYLLNAAVDNTKDPILGMLGVTNANAPIILLLLGMGCPPMQVFSLMKHPVLRACIDGINQRKYSNFDEAISKVYELYAKEKMHLDDGKRPKYAKTKAVKYFADPAFEKNLLSELSFNEKDIADNPELKEHSMLILKMMDELRAPANLLMTAIKLSRPFSKSGELAVTLEGILAQQFNREDFSDQLSKAEFSSGPFISGLEELIKPVGTQGCYDTEWVEDACENLAAPEVNVANDLMYGDAVYALQRHLPQLNPDWRKMAKRISSMYGYKTHQTGTIRRALNDMLLYLIMSDDFFWGKTPDEQRKKKLDILHGVPKRLIKLKKRILMDDSISELRGNKLLELLELFTPSGDSFYGSGLSLMSLNNSNDTIVDSEEVRAAWGDLIRSNDADVRQFGYDLYLYELMRSGMDPSYNGYIQFAPMNIFYAKQEENFATSTPIARLIEGAFRDHDWTDEAFNQRFLTYYCMNHWQDKGFLTSISKNDLLKAGGQYTTPKKGEAETDSYWTIPWNAELAMSLFRLPVVIVSRTERTASDRTIEREDLFAVAQSADGKFIYLKQVKKLGVAFRRQRKQVVKQYDPMVDPLDAEPLVSAHTIEEHGAHSETKVKKITVQDGKRKRVITVPTGIDKDAIEARIAENRALGMPIADIVRGIWTEQEEKAFAESGTAKVIPSVRPITRTAAMMNQTTLYIFADNSKREGGTQPISDNAEYSKKYGTGLKYSAKGALRLRGLDNALPISTKKTKMDSSEGVDGRWTDADFEQFKVVVDNELAAIKEALNSGRFRKVSVEGFEGKSFIDNPTSGITAERTPKIYEYLKSKLDELNLIVAEPEAPAEVEPEVPKRVATNQTGYTAKNAPGLQDFYKQWLGINFGQGSSVVQHNMTATMTHADGSTTTITATTTGPQTQQQVKPQAETQPRPQQQPQAEPKPNSKQVSSQTNLPEEFKAWAKEKFGLDASTMPPEILGGFYGMWQQEAGKKMYHLYRKKEDGNYELENAPITPDNTREARRQAVQILLNQRLRKILESKNVSVGVLLDFEQRLTDALDGQSYVGVAGDTNFDMFDTAKLTAEGMYEIIRLAKGELGESALPEEFAHLALAMLGDHKLVTRLMDLLMQNEELMNAAYGEEYEVYAAAYGHDRQKLAFEAAGKLVAEHLFKQADVMYRNQEERGIINKFKGLISRVAAAIKRFFATLNPHSVRNAINEAEDTASMIAEGLLAGDLVDQMDLGNIDMSGKLFQLQSKKIQQDLTNKHDVLSRLLRVETKRLSILKAQNEHTFKNKFNERLQLATEKTIAGLEKSIQQHQTETAVITYMESGMEILRQTSDNMDLAIRKAETNAQACRALNATRQTLFSYVTVLDAIQQALRDKELEDTTGLRTTFNTMTAALNELRTRYYQYADACFREALTEVYGPNGRMITVGKNKGKVRTIEEMAAIAERDETLASRWFNSLADAQDDVLTAVDDIIRTAKITARRYINTIRPRIETAFADLVRETGSKDQTFMFEYETDKNGVKHKTGKYISNKSKAYAKLTPAQKKFYDTMMDIKEEADKRLPDSLVSKYKMVMLRKYTLEKVKSSPDVKSGVKAFWEGIQQSLLDTSDNIDFENVEVIEDFEGNRVDMLPIKYVAKGENESYDDMVDDVATSMMAYVGMAYQYNELYGIAATIENMKYMSSERDVKQREFGGKNMRQTVETEDYRFTKPLTKKQMHTNIQKMLDDAIRMHLYGHTTVHEGTIGKTRLDKRKISNFIMRITSLSQMAFNPLQRVANVTTGTTQIALEGVGTGLFKTKDAIWASGIYAKESADRIAQTGKTDYDNKLSLFNDKFDIHQDNMRKTPKYGKGRFSRTFNSGLMYAGLTMGEDYLACVTALAVARNIKCKGPNGEKGSLWDAYEVRYADAVNKAGAYLALKDGWTKADGSAITTADEAAFSKKVAGLNFQLQGIYNLDDKSAVQQWCLGSFLIMYRKWIAPSLKRRYGVERYNALTQRDEEGYYRTLFRFISDSFKSVKKGSASEEATEEETKEMAQNVFSVLSALKNGFSVNWQNMTEYEKSNVKRCGAELGTIFLLFLACAALTHVPPPEDEEKQPTRMEYLVFYQMLRLRNELAAQAPTPMFMNEAMKILRSPFAAAEPIINVLNAWKILWPANWVTEVRSGRYKGHTKAYKYFRELPVVSMWKRAENIVDPTPLIRYYENDQIL